MKLYKSILILLCVGALGLTSCRDDFAELNTNKTSIAVPEPSYLLSMGELQFQTNGYLYWFYNSKMLQKWCMMGTSSGYNSDITNTTATGGQGSQYLQVMIYRNELQNYIDNYSDTDKYLAYRAALDVLTIYCAIHDTDVYGDIPYTEAAMLKYGGTLTPAYDSLEDLYDLWLEDLETDMEVFQREDQEMPNQGSQDLVYQGDMDKWAKLANSLRLKIAVRLYNQNSSRALAIANTVANANVGYIDSNDDDMFFAKATSYVGSEDQDYIYNTGNGLSLQYATADVIQFMLDTKDPRIRFVYKKNSFNSTIVQGFIDDGRYADLPTLVKENINLDSDGNFESWGGLGEPWVRYIGIPMDEFNASTNSSSEYYEEYFSYGTRYNLSNGTATKGYTMMSQFQDEQIRGRVDFTLPTLPGDATIEDTDDNPWYMIYMTAAEVNLYLAEFALLGATLPNDAEYYYKRGITLSVQAYDNLAAANKIPYYGDTWISAHAYDPNEASIALQDGEIDDMLATDGVQLTGTTSEMLEKVYLQQLMHFSLYPDDQFTTARRSGVPMTDSELLPYRLYSGIVVTGIPRRLEISSPSPTDQMYELILQSLEDQGFTAGSSQAGNEYNNIGTVLNTERIWFDKTAPQWGEGPK